MEIDEIVSLRKFKADIKNTLSACGNGSPQ